MKNLLWPVMAMIVLATAAGVYGAENEREKRRAGIRPEGVRPEEAKKRPVDEIDKEHDRRRYILSRLSLITETKFVRKNSDQDILSGFITHAVKLEDKYVAYVFLVWGDLDKVIPRCAAEFYSNWDGYVKVDGADLRTVREFAFDDGTPCGPDAAEKLRAIKALIEERKAAIRAARDKAAEKAKIEAGNARARAQNIKNTQKRKEALAAIEQKYREAITRIDARCREALERTETVGEPREGSGRDKLDESDDPAVVKWRAGVVGATDGLLIRIDLDRPEASGEIKAGQHVIPFEITYKTREAIQAALQAGAAGGHADRAARREERGKGRTEEIAE